jgi:hypothetical protein
MRVDTLRSLTGWWIGYEDGKKHSKGEQAGSITSGDSHYPLA